MTLRKYKKILMSYGVDRDQAEVERKQMAKRKRGAVELGRDPEGTMFTRAQIEKKVSRMKRLGGLSRRGTTKWLREAVKRAFWV